MSIAFMFESTRGRRLVGMLVVLLGVVLALPTLGSGPLRSGSAALACVEAAPAGGETSERASIVPSACEEQDSDVEDALEQRATAGPLHVYAASSTRFEAAANEQPRPNAGHSVLARQRGPPV